MHDKPHRTRTEPGQGVGRRNSWLEHASRLRLISVTVGLPVGSQFSRQCRLLPDIQKSTFILKRQRHSRGSRGRFSSRYSRISTLTELFYSAVYPLGLASLALSGWLRRMNSRRCAPRSPDFSSLFTTSAPTRRRSPSPRVANRIRLECPSLLPSRTRHPLPTRVASAGMTAGAECWP